MCNVVSVRNSILNYELQKKTTGDHNKLTSNEVKGQGKLDANCDGKISQQELRVAAKKAGVDFNKLTLDEKHQVAHELSTFVTQGGSFAKSKSDPVIQSFDFEITPTSKEVKAGKAHEDGSLPSFKLGQSGPEIKKLNNLLKNLGFEAKGWDFTERTESFVKDFQLRNFFTKDPTTGEMTPKPGFENIVLGQVDAKTLYAMEEDTKSETPYIVNNNYKPVNKPVQTTPAGPVNNPTVNTPQPTNTQPPSNTGNTTPPVNTETPDSPAPITNVSPPRAISSGELGKFESTRMEVKNQIVNGLMAKGLSRDDAEKRAEESFSLGSKLTSSIIRQDRARGTDGMCYTAVKSSLADTLGIAYKRYTNAKGGDSARTAPNTLFKERADLFQKISIPRDQVGYLPPGAVVVYTPPDKSRAGHIGVETMQLKNPLQMKNGGQGLPVSNVYEKDGQIIGFDVKTSRNQTVRYSIEDGKIKDQNGKDTNLSVAHADISDKQRNDPWSAAPVDVYYPIDTAS